MRRPKFTPPEKREHQWTITLIRQRGNQERLVVHKSTFSIEAVEMMRLPALLTISLVVAVGSVLVDFFVRQDSPMATHFALFAPAAVWLMLLIAALVVHGKRGLWLLVGAPFALFIPLLWAHLYFVCQCSIFQEEGDQRGDLSITDPEQKRHLIAQRSEQGPCL